MYFYNYIIINNMLKFINFIYNILNKDKNNNFYAFFLKFILKCQIN